MESNQQHNDMAGLLIDYKAAMQKELTSILGFWMTNTVDDTNGGFTGQIDYNNKTVTTAPKGAVLNARILWSFAAAYNTTGNVEYLDYCERAYQYIINNFFDTANGGVYWTVDYKGKPLDTKKQVYAQAFTVYALSEFYKSVQRPEIIQQAINLYGIIIKYSHDKINGGYIEAFTKDWKPIEDLRLSSKDSNEKKTMNTHLHVLEAFTNLYGIWPNPGLNEKIRELLQDFSRYIINPETGSQYLYMNENWQPKSQTISYGHDIETSWLLQEAASAINNEDLLQKIKNIAVMMATAAARGIDEDGGMWYEYEPEENFLIKEKHMWPQAEAMVGFFNAWQNTGDDTFLNQSFASWQFVLAHIHDKKNGEWFWGVTENYTPMEKDKVGIWKCPYHNTRACIEIIRRVDKLLAE